MATRSSYPCGQGSWLLGAHIRAARDHGYWVRALALMLHSTFAKEKLVVNLHISRNPPLRFTPPTCLSAALFCVLHLPIGKVVDPQGPLSQAVPHVVIKTCEPSKVSLINHGEGANSQIQKCSYHPYKDVAASHAQLDI